MDTIKFSSSTQHLVYGRHIFRSGAFGIRLRGIREILIHKNASLGKSHLPIFSNLDFCVLC